MAILNFLDLKLIQSPRLTNFCWISVACHLIAAMCLISYAHDSSLRNPKPEPICFVNLNDIRLPFPNSSQPAAAPTRENAPVAQVKTEAQKTQTVPPTQAPPPIQEKVAAVSIERAPAQLLPPVNNLPAQSSRPQPSTSSDGSSRSETLVSGNSNQPIFPKINNTSQGASKGSTLSDVAFGSGSGPSFLHRESPVYPLMAKRFNQEGKVVLRLTIDEGGALKYIEIIDDPGFGLASAAVEAVKKSSFVPARLDGKPVMAKAILPVRFALQ